MVTDVLIVGALDWTIVTAAVLAGVFSIANTFVGFLLYRYMRVPSGGKLGSVMERTHANSAVTVAAIPELLHAANGEHDTRGDDDEPLRQVGSG